MKVTRKSLDSAVEEKIISADQANALFQFLRQQPTSGPSFDFTHVLYYFGGLIAIGAMSLFMTVTWVSYGSWGVLIICLGYALIGLNLLSIFQSKGYSIPAGICATFVVVLTPLAIYSLQKGLGWWDDDTVYGEYHKYVKGHWIYMELGTLAVGVIMAWKYRYPFLIMPIALTLWYLSMDIAEVIVKHPSSELRSTVSIYFGLLSLCLAFWVDIRGRKTADYAFWLYIFGVMIFWGGLSTRHSDDEISKFIYFSINLLMIGTGVLLVRRVFVVFGAAGCTYYLSHLASNVFADSLLFLIVLAAIGLLIIYLGVLWQKNERAIVEKARSKLPLPLKKLLEAK